MMNIGDAVTIRTGTITNIVEYKDLNLKYYCVKIYEPWKKGFDLVWVEEQMLNTLMSPQNKDITSVTHIKEYNENTINR